MEKPEKETGERHAARAEILSLSDTDIRFAAKALAAGRLVAFPTETVYGLGADAFNSAAVAKVFAAKGRPRFDPLIVHIARIEHLALVADIDALPLRPREKADALCRAFWPGPLTIILPKTREVPLLVTSGLPAVAVRLPDHDAARKLIELSTGAVAAPSANPFGGLSPTRAEHVLEGLGNRIDLILDGGRTGIGVESTVVSLSSDGEPRILRPGGLSREAIEAVIGPVAVSKEVSVKEGQGIAAPGQLPSHYAPRTGLTVHGPEEMAALPYRALEGYLFFSAASRLSWLQRRPSALPEEASRLIRTLSETGNITEAGANFFDMLHGLDRIPLSVIRAEQAPECGVGTAINDRLSRAAAAAGPQPPAVS
ncbi:MAG: threonylcarbamoyl-AMP synthase [Spirochaetaceae bacterium]|jgi:L-threonylcarbamoyladenylate synthase|nr:threonylcarbamoyl-AMP synthase [Spirochaetaceae bacterium]